MDKNNIQKHIDQYMHEQNNRSIAEFEGYSPFEMHNLLNYTFDGNSPISFQKATKADYARVPMLNQMKYFLDLINKSGELKLTAKGFLPTKLVKQIYDQEFLEEGIFYAYKPNVFKESDSMTVNLTRLLADLCGLTKKRNNKLSLTKTGERLLAEDNTLFELVFKTITTKFNWAYYDAYGDNHIGQTGFGFSLILLHKYGETKRQDAFYAEKYFKAFPDVFSTDSQMGLKIAGNWANTCYSLRTFDRFLSYFGFIKIEEVGKKWKPDKFIAKTDLFDKLIKVQPHNPINLRPN